MSGRPRGPPLEVEAYPKGPVPEGDGLFALGRSATQPTAHTKTAPVPAKRQLPLLERRVVPPEAWEAADDDARVARFNLSRAETTATPHHASLDAAIEEKVAGASRARVENTSA